MPSIVALLNSHLGDTRQGSSVLFERSCISEYVNFWVSGNGEIVLNTNAACAVRLHVQPFSTWRWGYSCRPDDDIASDTLSADDNPVRVNLVNAVPFNLVRTRTASDAASSMPVGPASTKTKVRRSWRKLGLSSASARSKAFRTLLRIRTSSANSFKPDANSANSSCPKWLWVTPVATIRMS